MNNPELYEKFNLATRRDIDDFSNEFSDAIGKISGRCLDIGTGPGDVVVDFILPKIHPTATIVCSDISDSMVNYAKEKYKNNHRLSFIKLDIGTPNLSKDLIEQFDHATSFYCLHWCQDLGRVFENIFNLLRPGGNAFLIFLSNFPTSKAYKALAAMPRYQPYMKDADLYVPAFHHVEQPISTLEALIKNVGFEIHHCSVREINHAFNNSDDMGKFVLSLNPFVTRMPADLMDGYTKDLVKEVVKQNSAVKNSNINANECSAVIEGKIFVIHLIKPLTNPCGGLN